MAANKKGETTQNLANDFVRVAERYYTSWPQLLARSFAAGLFTALGATVGFALIIWLTGLLLNSLGVLPGVGDFFARLNTFLHTATGR